MRLLLVFFGDDYHGGTTHSTFAIAKELVRRGHEVHAFARVTPAGTLAHDLAECGVVVHDGRAPIMVHPLEEPRPLYRVLRLGLEQARRYLSLPKAEREVAKAIRDCGIDLVAISSGAIITGARAARDAGIPYVWHAREFMQEDHGLEPYAWAHSYELMGGATRLICVSRAVEEKMLRVCPGARTEVVYNGLDLDTFHPDGREPLPEGAPVRIMTSGGIRQSKGTFLALEAIARLGRDVPVTFDVFGGEGGGVGESADDLRATCERLGIADLVRYRGSVGNIADELRRHDIQIVASRAEAFGRVTAEAMLCGCAVVGSASGGTPELVSDDRGYLFAPEDANSLAQALAEAIGDPTERGRRAARALGYARDNFSVKAYVDRVEAIYRSAAS